MDTRTIRFEVTLDAKGSAKLEGWRKKHRHRDKPSASGGGLTYEFTPTGIGTVIQVSCFCGKQLDLTNYDEW